ncbi:hypothetical protein EST38_g5391 [Candolleomyces aberdarensis]|uniref:Dynactin subunit 6 n=1 Tax=Candolleomyces aberdarensis TaxID=2316362 RepID=A0A4Q2DKK6_9AGAR|nr:hypothetical protein EST38_g5391 [Candolleomyces aberdarensis]
MRYSVASTLLIVSTNIIVTALIVFRLLRARQNLTKLLPSADVGVYTGVIAMLIESAAPPAIFGIIVAAITLGRVSGALSNSSEGTVVCSVLFVGLFYSFCSLSPHMIIFRVTTGRSFTKLPSAKGVPTNPIQFAPRTAESSFLQLTLNRNFSRSGGADTEQGLKFSISEPSQTQTRDKFTIHSKAVVCQDVELKGDITIGAGTIVHPKATIFAIAGPIVIGAGCIIEEATIIVNR